MNLTGQVNKHNSGGLIGGMIYLGLGVFLLTSYFLEKKGIKMKILQKQKPLYNQSCQPNESQIKTNILQN